MLLAGCSCSSSPPQIYFPVAGTWSFSLLSDDGSRIWIDNTPTTTSCGLGLGSGVYSQNRGGARVQGLKPSSRAGTLVRSMRIDFACRYMFYTLLCI